MLLVDGRPHGQTPATVTDLPLGLHTIDVARPGYVPSSTKVTLTGQRQAQTLSITLQAGKGDGGSAAARGSTAGRAASALGSVFVDSRPRGARVMIDGRVVGDSPLLVPELPPGDHTIQVELTGHRPFTTHVALKAGQQARVSATLEERNEE
jgi:hypothetical protein